MIPEPGRALNDLALRLLFNVAPQTANTFAAADTALVGQLVMTLAQEFERAVAVRMEDIEEIKALLRDAASSPARQAFLDRSPASLHLKDVNAVHDQGMQLLIELHAEAELSDAAMNERIWKFLRANSERHKFE